MVKRGHEVDLEYSKGLIVDKMNIFFGYKVINKIKLIPFDGEKDEFKEKNPKDVTKKEYTEKISGIKNKKIKKSLLTLSKLFTKK